MIRKMKLINTQPKVQLNDQFRVSTEGAYDPCLPALEMTSVSVVRQWGAISANLLNRCKTLTVPWNI